MAKTLEQKLEEGAKNLNAALAIYIQHRRTEVGSTCFGNSNSFFGMIGGYDADAKIQAAQNVINGKRISQNDLSMLEDGRLGKLMLAYGRPENVCEAVRRSDEIAASREAHFYQAQRWSRI